MNRAIRRLDVSHKIPWPAQLTVAAALLLAGCPDLQIKNAIEEPCIDPVQVTVARVLDGDTFESEEPIELGAAGSIDTFRLLCVDTPETGDCYHDEAADELRRRIEGKTVTLYFESECTGTYGRGLTHVFQGGRSVNLALARDGWSPLIEAYFRGYASCDPILDAARRSCEAEDGGWGECGGAWPWDICPE